MTCHANADYRLKRWEGKNTLLINLTKATIGSAVLGWTLIHYDQPNGFLRFARTSNRDYVLELA